MENLTKKIMIWEDTLKANVRNAEECRGNVGNCGYSSKHGIIAVHFAATMMNWIVCALYVSRKNSLRNLEPGGRDMKCDCGVKLPDKWNWCSACGEGHPDKNKGYSLAICHKCGREMLLTDNYCCFCREPNRFKMAAILFEMEGRWERKNALNIASLVAMFTEPVLKKGEDNG